jgi:hypothetical protein
VLTIDDVLATATATGTTIHTIGLGLVDPVAIGVMQNLAFSSGGTFSSAAGADDLELTFTNLAASLSGGHLVVTVVFTTPPAAGTSVSGAILVEDVTGSWSFVVP